MPFTEALNSLLEKFGVTNASQLDSVLHQRVTIATAILALILVTILVFRANRKLSLGSVEVKSVEQSYTKEEVAKHNKRDDAWIILKGKVYNVSPYVEEHPGGEAILRNVGSDSTDGFFGPQHPERVFDLIEDFYIGQLA